VQIVDEDQPRRRLGRLRGCPLEEPEGEYTYGCDVQQTRWDVTHS
jgi:hypothetical protein